MKNRNFLFALTFIGLLLGSCNTDENQTTQTDSATDKSTETISTSEINEENFEKFDLRPYEINASLMLPKEDDITVKHQLDGFTWEILIDNQVYITIQDWGTENGLEQYLQQVKNENKIIDLIKEEDDFVSYKETIGTNEITYHTAAQHSIEGINYVFKSTQTGRSKDEIEYVTKSVE